MYAQAHLDKVAGFVSMNPPTHWSPRSVASVRACGLMGLGSENATDRSQPRIAVQQFDVPVRGADGRQR